MQKMIEKAVSANKQKTAPEKAVPVRSSPFQRKLRAAALRRIIQILKYRSRLKSDPLQRKLRAAALRRILRILNWRCYHVLFFWIMFVCLLLMMGVSSVMDMLNLRLLKLLKGEQSP